jgi:hypothetical protein
MPVLQFKGKTAVENYHHTVPHHTLEFDPKLSVLPKGEKPSLEGNLIIEGDNLLALKALLPTHAGRVKCIYIDPPYNTGNEGWVYNDNLTQPPVQRMDRRGGKLIMEKIRQRSVLKAVLLQVLSEHAAGLETAAVYDAIDQSYVFPEEWYRQLPDTKGVAGCQRQRPFRQTRSRVGVLSRWTLSSSQTTFTPRGKAPSL